MPQPNKSESMKHFVSRFMGSKEAGKSFPKPAQRAAVAYSEWKERKKRK